MNDFARHERELGALSTGLADVKSDVNQVAEESRKSRHDLRNQIQASELRVNQHLDARVGALETRIDRMITTGRWVIGVSVPAVATLAGILIGKN